MKHPALFLSPVTAAMLASPAFAVDGASGMMGFRWGKNAFNFEGMPSGPQPLRNLSRRRMGPPTPASSSAIIAIRFSRPKPPPS